MPGEIIYYIEEGAGITVYSITQQRHGQGSVLTSSVVLVLAIVIRVCSLVDLPFLISSRRGSSYKYIYQEQELI